MALFPFCRMRRRPSGQRGRGHPALVSYGGREHAAAVSLRNGETTFVVLLLLPTREAAQGWAAAACPGGGNAGRAGDGAAKPGRRAPMGFDAPVAAVRRALEDAGLFRGGAGLLCG